MSARGFCPPAIPTARLNASCLMGQEYKKIGTSQQKSLSRQRYQVFGSLNHMRDVDKVAFGRRFKQRREALQLSQGDVASQVGMTQQGVAAIERGVVSRPGLLDELAAVLKTTPKWLLRGEGQQEAAQEPSDAANITHVPLVDWVTAGRFANPASQIPIEKVPLLAFADLGRGDFFALKVEGDSMNLVSPEGSIIVVDRADRTPVSGKCYVFSLRGETTYKVWRGGDPSYLEPLTTNTILHKPIFPKGKKGFEIVGRVRRTLLDL